MQLLLIITSAWIAYQDFKYRAVHWILFGLLSLMILHSSLSQVSLTELMLNTGINFLLLMIQWAGISLYFSLRYGHFINIMDRFIGWGDAVLFLVLAFYFPPAQFIVFMFLSLLFSLFFAILQIRIFKGKVNLIPLAAWVSISFITLLAVDYVHPQKLIHSEYGIHLILSQFNLS